MSMEKLKTVADQVMSRSVAVRGRGEEATKQALVLPVLDALGFDIWNPEEVCPEYCADFSIKKLGQKEKVDLAIVINGIPRIYIEVKSIESSLEGHEGQLARYFNSTPAVPLGIITNGVEYRFYSDTGEQNIMDKYPFHVARLDSIDQGLDILYKFHKSNFSPDEIRDFATQINYTKKIYGFLKGHIDLGEKMPNENFMRWILSEDGNYGGGGKITAKVVERFQPIVKDAMQMVLKDIVRRSFAALDKEVSYPTAALAKDDSSVAVSENVPGDVEVPADKKADERAAKVVTTANEIRLFEIAKGIFQGSRFSRAEIFDANIRKSVPVEIGCKDTTGYFGVYLNKSSYWIMRAVVESKNPWIGFNVTASDIECLLPPGVQRMSSHPYAEFRVAISSVEELSVLAPLLESAIKKTIEDRKKDSA